MRGDDTTVAKERTRAKTAILRNNNTPPRQNTEDGDEFVGRRTNAQRAAVQFSECSGQWIVARCVCGAHCGGVGVAHAYRASTAVRLKCVQLSHTLCVRPPFSSTLQENVFRLDTLPSPSSTTRVTIRDRAMSLRLALAGSFTLEPCEVRCA